MVIRQADLEAITLAAELLKSNEVVAFPTETVYGLGGNALSDDAIAKVYKAKNRPSNNPLIIHVSDLESACKYGDLNEEAITLASYFWPGPLTLVVPRKKDSGISSLVTRDIDSIAIRMPSHIIALEILAKANVPIAAPSANVSGRISPTTAENVCEELGDKINLIIDGGNCSIGIESTVVDMTTPEPIILRPGFVTKEQIENVLGKQSSYNQGKEQSLKSPGMLASHYAPSIPVRLNADEVREGEVLLAFGDRLPKGDYISENLSLAADLNEAAKNLYLLLRKLDTSKFKSIAVMPVPYEGIGVAINDRLSRAAAPK
jgi:L-threonylcarbamoyladenylate synthase